MKKVLAALTALTLLFSLVGCSGSKEKTVENYDLTITISEWDNETKELAEPFEVSGSYTGLLVDGLPEGEGSFTAVNNDGITWTYTGNFENGTFNGYGTTSWDDDTGVNETGTYTDGAYTPTAMEILTGFIGDVNAATYSVSAGNKTFIAENADLFPAATDDARLKVDSLANADLSYAQMAKSLSGYEGQTVSLHLIVTQIMEETIFGHTISHGVAVDPDYNYYYFLYPDALPGVLDGTGVETVALPIAASGFDNIGGGTTNVIVIFPCYMDIA